MKQVEVRHFREGETSPDPLAMVKVSNEAADKYEMLKQLGITVDVRRVRTKPTSPCKIEVQLVHGTDVWDSYTVPDHGGLQDNAPRLAVEKLLLTFDSVSFKASLPSPEKA